jgi:hypothetical protein
MPALLDNAGHGIARVEMARTQCGGDGNVEKKEPSPRQSYRKTIKMPDQKSGLDSGYNSRSKAGIDGSTDGRIGWAVAAVTAQGIMMEALVHTLCFELEDMSRTRLLKVLDIVHDQLEGGLGSDDETVRAFGEQRDSMRSLLVGSVMQAGMESALDE